MTLIRKTAVNLRRIQLLPLLGVEADEVEDLEAVILAP